MNRQVTKNRTRKILAYSAATIVFVLLSSFLVLQMPPVQNRLIGHYLGDFSKVTGFPTTVESFRMLWFDRLELHGVKVHDPAGNVMISAEEILINFRVAQLLQPRDINVDGIFIDSAQVFLTKIQESDTSRDLNINVFTYRLNHNFKSGGGGGRPPRINIGETFLNKSKFIYVNQDRDTVRHGFDYNHFALDIDEGELKSFVVLGDTIEFDVRTLIAEDSKTKFRIGQLSTFFRISQKAMEFSGLSLNAGKSVITDTIVFLYDSQRDLNNFVHLVKVDAHLDNTTIYPKDLDLFFPGAAKLEHPLVLEGDFKGRIDKFKFTNMKVRTGNSNIQGSLEMDGLPNLNETFIVLNMRNSRLDPNDLSFVLNEQSLQRLQPMGVLNMDGQFLGYPNDFVANGNFTGAIGTIKSDINFKVDEEDFNRSVYSGKVKLSGFDLGRYLNDTLKFQKVDLEGQVKGAGLTLKTADFQLNGVVSSLGINRYNYSNIKTDARFASGLFRGMVEINDPNLEFSVRGSIDLREGRNEFKIRAQLDTAYLRPLNITRDSTFLRATVDANFKGLQLDSLQGTANVTNLTLHYKKEKFQLDNIFVDAQRDKRKRSLAVQSSLIDADVKGNYTYTSISRDIQALIKEISLNIKNDKEAIAQYYRQKKSRPQNYEALIKVNLKDIKPITKLLNLDLKITPRTRLEGRFTSGFTTIFNAYTSIDSISFEGKTFVGTQVELNTSKIADSTSVLSMATIVSERQLMSKNLTTKNLLAEIIWDKSHVDFGLDVDQDGRTNNARLRGTVDFLRDSTTISMLPSSLKLLERDWNFAPGNFISVHGKEWNFNEFVLRHENQSVRLHGRLSTDPTKPLTLNANQVDLSLLNELTLAKLAGIVNAEVDVYNYYRDITLQNEIKIDQLMVNDFLVGDITGKNQWDTLNNKFDISFFIDRQGTRILDVDGEYKPKRSKDPLNLTANLEKANLKLLEPFLQGIFTNMSGTTSGAFTITGSLSSPEIRGDGQLEDAQLMVSYLKTMYRVNGVIGLTPTSINFKGLELTDIFRNKGKLNGYIKHENFNKMSINIDASFRNFQVLNTTMKDNSLFYGQGYATGDLKIHGPVANLKISSDARTDKNTRIYVPLSQSSSVDKKEFIQFVNFRDTTFQQKREKRLSNKVNLTGLTFDLNLDVTPDAYCEIIFDLKAGDIIRGRGNGDLKLQLDTKGEFNMFGPFEFTEGWYNFTLYDIINKEFVIKRGSRISWYGDPYQATVDINASYNQLASLAPLTDASTANSPALQRKYPIEVVLDLEGSMMSPTITFDIVAVDLPKNIQTETGQLVNLDLQFTAFKNKLDEQELKRQVFSLIVLRRFSPVGQSMDASGSVVNSLSELLSNQLSNWMSQVDEDLTIDVDLGTMDQETFNTFQLRLSYTFLNGRLRVTGDGTFNNSSTPTTGSSSQTNPSGMAGDWTVDYMLTPDGKLRVKMYSRTNVNAILSSVNNQNTITTGASLIHTQSFNQLRELWTSSRKKREEQQKKEEEQKKAPDPELKTEAIKEDDDGPQ